MLARYKVIAPIQPGIGSAVHQVGEIVTDEQVSDVTHFIKIGAIEPIEVKKQEVEQKKVKTEKAATRRTRKKSGEK